MNNIAKLSLMMTAALTLGMSFVTSAHALPGVKPKGASLQDLQTTPATPEITAAETRVEQAKAQVDLANKQVNASRALLRAAQADLKAAAAQLGALKLGATAQGLVDQTGMTPAKAAPVSIAAKAQVEVKDQPSTAPTPSITAPTPSTALTTTTEESRIKTDFNAEPVGEPIQLR